MGIINPLFQRTVRRRKYFHGRKIIFTCQVNNPCQYLNSVYTYWNHDLLYNYLLYEKTGNKYKELQTFSRMEFSPLAYFCLYCCFTGSTIYTGEGAGARYSKHFSF